MQPVNNAGLFMIDASPENRGFNVAASQLHITQLSRDYAKKRTYAKKRICAEKRICC